jgi:hypothetical protein
MATKTFGEEVAQELAGKTVMWGLLLGPVGIVLGLLTSASIVASGNNGNSSPRDGDQETK